MNVNMEQLLKVILCICLCRFSTCLDVSETGDFASLNNIIDEIIHNVQTNSKEVSILTFPDLYKENEKGETFNLTKGKIINLSTIKRVGDSTISYSSKILSISVQFGFTDLQVDFDFNVKAWDLNPTGSMKCSLSDYKIEAEVQVDLNKLSVTVDKLLFPTTGDINISVTKMKPIYEAIMEPLISTFTYLFQDIIVYEIGQVIKQKINIAIHNILTL